MKYISPLSFFEPGSNSSDPVVDRKKLSFERKKLLAEIDLSENKTVVINGEELNKNDVLNLFDRLQYSNELDHHIAIANDPELLYFLIYGGFTDTEHFADNALYDEPSFIHFIAPYFHEPFSEGVLNSFKNNDPEFLALLFQIPLLLDGSHREKSFTRILRYLYEKKNRLLAVKEEAICTKKAVPENFMPYVNRKLIEMLNLLPAEFQNFRDDFALDLINTGVGIQRIHPTFAVEILGNVRQLDCDAHLKQQNEERYDLLVANALRDKSNNRWGFRFKGYPVFFIIFMVLRVVFFTTRCHSSGDNQYSYYNSSNQNAYVLPGHDPIKTAISELDFLTTSRHKSTVSFINLLSTYKGSSSNAERSIRSSGVRTGSDLYRSIFNAARINNGSANAKLYQEKVQFENASDNDVVAVIETADSTYSCFINRHDTGYASIRDGYNRICFYIGNNWNASKQITQPLVTEGSNKLVLVKGVFTNPSPVSGKYLKESFFLTADEKVASQQDHRSFFTITTINGVADIEFETLSSLRVTMKRKS